ncbi:MAG: hypothetical protein QM811_06655 [Pirellulales bacterium]
MAVILGLAEVQAAEQLLQTNDLRPAAAASPIRWTTLSKFACLSAEQRI